MKKRIGAVVLCFCMALSLVPLGALAEGTTPTFSGEVTLSGDATYSSSITISSNTTIDLKGFTLTTTAADGFTIEKGGSLTIVDTSTNGSGKIAHSGSDDAIRIKNGGSLTINGGTISSTAAKYGPIMCSQGTVTMTGGTISASGDKVQALTANGSSIVSISGGSITSDFYAICLFGNSTLNFSGEASATSNNAAAISTNGSKEGDTNYANGATVNISGGTLTSTNDGAVYAPAGTFNVTGGTMTGKTAFYAKGGKITISDGTFVGNGTKTEFKHSGNGWYNTGDALVVESCDYPYSPATISVTGGNFKSTNASAVGVYAYTPKDNEPVKPAEGFLSGGYFSTAPNEKYVATGYQVVENDGTNSKASKTDYPYMIGMEQGAEEAAKEVAVTPATASADPDVTVSATENKEKAEAAAQSVTGADKVSTTDVQKDNDKNTAKDKLIENNLVSFSATKESGGKWTYSLAEDTAIYVVYETYFVVDAKEYDTTNKTITLDIKPKCDVIAVVGGTNAPTADEIDESNSVTLETRDVTVSGPVEISIDVTGLFTAGDTVWVKHTTEAGKNYLYKGAVKTEGEKTILTFTNPDGFSTFKIGVPAPVASVWAKDATEATNLYDSIPAAFADATDDCTVYILGEDTTLAANTKIKITNPMTVDVSQKSNDYEKIGTYLVADDTKVVMESNDTAHQYLFTKKDTDSGTSGGGGGATTYKVNPPASVDNGTVTVNPQNAAKGKTVTVTPKPDEGYKVDAVTVTDKDGKPVTVKDNGDGTYSFTMPASAVDVAVSFAKDETQPTTNEKFVDVPKDAYYHDAVYWAVDKGITEGVDATHFAPDATCTRAQMVTFLWRAAGQPAPTSSENPFTDVKEGAYYYDAVLWAVEKGITVGTSSTTFSPDDTVIRGQAVTFLWRYEGKPAPTATENPFSDVTSSDYFYQPVLWAVETNVTAGTSKTTFSPKANCLRSQVVTFLYRAAGQE